MRLHSRRSYALLSVAAALVTMALKFGAFSLTGSVGLLSDALESVVNLVAALVAVWALTLAAHPADEHTYGHSKAGHFSSGVEALIALAAALICSRATAPAAPQPIEQWGWACHRRGAPPSSAASISCSGGRGGCARSPCRPDARHLFTDVDHGRACWWE
jgi:divalent metal cation (Fe/Co/Zn/Cd) transporter